MNHDSRTTIACLLLMFSSNSLPASESITLTTTEWPPYAGSQLMDQGAASKIITQAFDAMDMDVVIKVMPWRRAISIAKKSKQPVAYYPGYHCNHMAGFSPSESFGTSPLGFAEHSAKPIEWQSLSDIGEQRLKIGTVRGYSNTEEFDTKVGTGWIRAISANDDTANLQALGRNRVDAVVIDQNVLQYLLKTNKELLPYAKDIAFDEKPLELKMLHLCFPDNEAGLILRDRFNKGLQEIDYEKIMKDYLRDLR